MGGFLVSAISEKKKISWKIRIKVPTLIGMRGRGPVPSSCMMCRATFPVNGSTYWGSLGAEINAAAHTAGAGQIKPLSAVPSQEGMRSCSSHQPQGSCQLCPSGGCCHDKLPKGASAQFFCLFHSRWAGRKQISSFSGSLAIIRLR